MNSKKNILLLIIVLLAIIQFFPIDRSNPKSEANIDLLEIHQPNDDIKKIMTDACYDCHSNKTKYPWYVRVQPIGWWMRNHIIGGRNKLNYSEWQNYPDEKKRYMATESINMINNNKMPLKSYMFTHSEARLTEKDKKLLNEFFKTLNP